jgi:hypothetical protein
MDLSGFRADSKVYLFPEKQRCFLFILIGKYFRSFSAIQVYTGHKHVTYYSAQRLGSWFQCVIKLRPLPEPQIIRPHMVLSCAKFDVFLKVIFGKYG